VIAIKFKLLITYLVGRFNDMGIEKIQQLRTVREAKSLTIQKGEPHGREPKRVAKNVLNPVQTAAQSVAKIAELDLQENLNSLCGELEEHLVALKSGDNSLLEATLSGQIAILNIAFAHFLDKAQAATDNSTLLTQKPELITGLAAIALKCQDQTRKTIATLSEIKNPKKPTQFIRSYVDKQLNQLRLESDSSQQQLEGGSDAPLDNGYERAAAPDDSTMETLEQQHWPEKPRRKAKGKQKRSAARDAEYCDTDDSALAGKA
jgi:hypothetical protein